MFKIEWDLVASALTSEPDVALFDVEEVMDAVVKATDKYLARDLEELRVQGIEEEFEFTHAGQKRRGYIDLRGERVDGPLVVDWKSTGTLDEKWAWRELRSEQTIYYSHALHVINNWNEPREVNVEVRGVNRQGNQWQLKKLVTPTELKEFDQQSGMWSELQIRYWRDHGPWNVWPRNKPEGCRPFGPQYPCQFEGLCEHYREEKDPAHLLVVENGIPSGSFTSGKEFRRCPERWRLLQVMKLLGEEREDSPEAAWGKGFHRAIAEVYRQAFREEMSATTNTN